MIFIIRLVCTALVLSGIIFIPNAFAENVPSWIKNNAGWWATDKIDDTSFLQGIQYLIKEGIMVISPTETAEPTGSHEVPSWIKNNAGWWADGQIDDGSFVLGIQWLISNGIIIVEEKLIHTDVDFRVAFIGDQGLGPNAIAVLELIKDEGAQMVLHQGDLDYENDPDAWDQQISDVLGDDFPYFASIGHAESGIGRYTDWSGYQEKLYDRLKKNPDAICNGDLGVKSSCTYKGLFFILVGPGVYTSDSDYDSFIEKQLNDSDSNWRICSWHNSMEKHMLELKPNETAWGIYESCKNGGAIIANAHLHFYARSKSLIDFENQIVDPEWSESNKLRVKEGSTFTFVSGLGGRTNILTVPYHDDWPVFYYTAHNATHGALFCTFNAGGQSNNAYCYFKNIDGVIIDEFTVTNFVGIDDANSNRPEIDLSNKDLSGEDLTGAILIGANLTDVDLTGTILKGANLSMSNLTGADLSDKDLTGIVLKGANLTDVDLTGTVLAEAILSRSNLTGANLTDADLTGTIIREANLTDVDLTGTVLAGAILSRSNLTGANLTDADLTETILRETDLTDTILPDVGLSGKNFEKTIFNGVDLSGKDLSESIFDEGNFVDANLENAKLTSASFVSIDLTKIKNKSLAGADLTDASFAHSNLSGVNLADTIIDWTNFWKANISGVDFTVTAVNQKKNHISGSAFIESNLSNSNFEGVILSPKQTFSVVLENKAYLIRDQTQTSETQLMIKDDIFGSDSKIYIVSAKVLGNDLEVTYIFYNSFVRANLENANFKNAGLLHANFNEANLTNADFSGADLRSAFLDGANLSGADLTGAFIDESTILKCINHPICLD